VNTRKLRSDGILSRPVEVSANGVEEKEHFWRRRECWKKCVNIKITLINEGKVLIVFKNLEKLIKEGEQSLILFNLYV